MQRETHTIPIVFAPVSDPIGSGFVVSLSNPTGNITGFINIEASLSGKWIELIREVSPRVYRVGMMFNPDTAPYARYYLDTFRSAASAMAVEPIEAPVHSGAEVEAFLTKFGSETGAGLVVMPDTSTMLFRQTIIALAERYHLPAIYGFGFFAADGGLMSYGIDVADLFRGVAQLRGPHFERGKTERAAGSTSYQVRACYQSQNRQDARYYFPPEASDYRR
jgi:putative ABC transport system substrate-binding protein